jgi:alpha-tubulin suppressor-like RCC1 family protein
MGDYIHRTVPTRIPALSDKKIFKISIGGRHTLDLGVDGRMYSFGFNFNGQLGLGNTAGRSISQRCLITYPVTISLTSLLVHIIP